MMLQSLIEGKEPSERVLIQDSAGLSGQGLLKCFVTALTERLDKIHVVLCETCPDEFLCGLSPQCISRISIHDMTDPLGWHSQHIQPQFCMSSGLHINLKEETSSCETAVVIDCLTSLMLYTGTAHTCSILHHLSNSSCPGLKVKQVVTLVHTDTHDEHALKMLQHCATCWIKMKGTQSAIYPYRACFLHKKPTGKVTKKVEDFRLSSWFNLTDADEVSSVKEVLQEATAKPDPTADLTFNLTLTQKERVDRSKTALPYVKHQQRSDPGVPESKIFYQPDEADDFDEEDPDDDLDI